MADPMVILASAETIARIEKLLKRRFSGGGGIQVTQSDEVVSIVYRGQRGGGGASGDGVERATITGYASGFLSFLAKRVTPAGDPVGEEFELRVRVSPSGVDVRECHPTWEVGSIVPIEKFGEDWYLRDALTGTCEE